jgi:hypothetical protein
MSGIQNRINRLTAQISELDSMISSIDEAITSDSNVQCCLDSRRTNLDLRRTQLITRKNNLVEIASNDFSEDERTIIDEINNSFNNKYELNLLELRYVNQTRKDRFFNTYNAAESDFLRKIVIEDFFSII